MGVSKEKKAEKTKETTVKEKDTKKTKTTKKTTEADEIKENKVVKAKQSKKKINAALTKKEQKYFRIMSRYISVVAKILRVCAMILVPIIVILMIMVPIMFKNIEFNGNIIKFNNAKFILKDDNITLNLGDKNYVLADGIEDMDHILEFFYNNTPGKVSAAALLSLFALAVTIVISIYILQYTERLFNNFYKDKTPFESDNCKYIRNIGRTMICDVVISLIFNIIISLLFKGLSTISINSFSLTLVVGIYVIYFIFIYGTNMQKEIDTSIYD